MKRHNHRPPRRRTCDLCVHRRAKRTARATLRLIQIARRDDVVTEGYLSPTLEARRTLVAFSRKLITRANFNQPTLWMAV